MLLGFAGAGLGGLTHAWAGDVQNEALAQMIRNTDEVVMRTVKSLYQTHARPQKREWRPLPPEQKAMINARAIESVKMQLGPTRTRELAKSLGSSSPINAVLHHRVQSAAETLDREKS